ncbi:MAG: hypothetical protein J5507_01845 [Clostridia bacterium]|nr:hypothetical protein [Clostridia bacterium]
MKKNKFNKEKKLNKGRVVKTIIVVLLVVIGVTFAILYNKNERLRQMLDKYLFRKEEHENNLPQIEIDSSKISGMFAYDNYISIFKGNKLILYNKYGREEGNIDIEVSTPIFESNENYLVVAEKNGQKMYFINGKNLAWQKDIEGKINSVSVNKNGYVSIIIGGTSYKTVIKTVDSNGNELFTYYLGSTNVVATDISNDNKYLAIAEANFSGIVVQSTVKIISVEDAKNNTGNSIKYTHVANSGDLIINIKYQRNNLVCMYDEHIDILNNGQNSELVNLKNENVLFADISFSSKVIKIIKKNTGIFNSETEMQIIDSSSKNIVTYSIEHVPKSVYVKDNSIVINLGTSALFIKDNGWLQKKYESSHEIQNILSCGDVAGIVSKNKIEIISL